MPITLPPISRRRFLAGSLAAAACSTFPRAFGAAQSPNPHRLVLLSDIHLDADPKFFKMNANPWDGFAQACSEILTAPAPAAVLINGDLTHHQGNPEDYATVIEALKPLRQAGLTLHMTVGNHDNRENFFKAFATAKDAAADPARPREIPDRQTLLLEFPRANVLILDSL